MKITLLSENIQKKLPFVLHAIAQRTQLPILSNILFQAQKGKVIISATDLEIGIQVHIPANVEIEGEVTIPAKTFSEVVMSLPAGNITFSLEANTLTVKTKNTTSKFQTMPKDEFPSLYEQKGEEVVEIGKQILRKEFQKILFAASTDASRPALSGVLFVKEQENPDVLLVATDGYRLSLKKFTLPKKSQDKDIGTLLISARVIREALQLRDDDAVGIYVAKDKNQILFSQEEAILVGRLIDAQFPEYGKIIPKGYETRVVVERDALERAVKMGAVFARDGANIVRFSIDKEGVSVSANAAQVGENRVFIEAQVEGDGGSIAFNARYLLDLLANIEEKEIVFEMVGATNPGVFKIAGDESFLHIIMPIRVQE